eukprot:gene7796-8642_t
MFSLQANPKNVFNFMPHSKEILVQSPTGDLDDAEVFESCNRRSIRGRNPLRPSSATSIARPASPLVNRARPRSPNYANAIGSIDNNNVALSCGKIELFIRCEELLKMDAFSSSDPVCVLYVLKYGQWIEYERTECIPNCQKPKFAETFILDSNNIDHQNLKLSVFDSDNLASKDLHKHQLIGSTETRLSTLVTSSAPQGYNLQFQEHKSKRGKIYVTAEVADEQARNTNIKLRLCALKLSKKGLNIFGKCDAYFELERKLKDDRYHPVYRSEVIFRNSDPRWRPIEITLQKLCNGNKDNGVQITVFHFNPKGNHAFIGSAETSYSSMTERIGDVKTLQLRKGGLSRSASVDSKRGGHDSVGKSMVRILQCVPEEQYSLVDYVKGGCRVNFLAAIDFSLSNGGRDDESSLHYCDESQINVYEEALQAMGSWLSYYDARNRYKLYGFAGILNGDASSVSCFQLKRTASVKKQFIGGPSAIEELVSLYRSHLACIELSGPTLFTPVLKQMIKEDLKPEISQESQHYTLALILTDGVANDMEEFLDTLVTCSDKPISIIVVCLGPLRMETSHYFNILEDSVMKKCGRAMVYPVSFSDENVHISMQSARATFARLSKDIVKFFTHRNIRPNKPIMNLPRNQAETAYNDGFSDVIDHLEAAENENWKNYLKDATSYCPTCGSHAQNNSYMPEVAF